VGGDQVTALSRAAARQGTGMNAASMETTISGGQVVERRKHRRLAIRLPVECRVRSKTGDLAVRGTTANVSSGGVYIDIELYSGDRQGSLDALEQGRLLEVELTVPPGEGHFPYEGRVNSAVEIVRREEQAGPGEAGLRRRVGLAGRFHDPLKLSF
jgi:hypothetical protein